MASIFNVAQYILELTGPITTMKLQKLCYYSQAWALVWDEEPLFSEEIQAWANGPVIPELYLAHQGMFQISRFDGGDSSKLTTNQKDTIKNVVEHYGKYNPQQLSDMTHMEAPWKDARQGIPEGERTSTVIPLANMQEYYSSLS